MNEKSKPPSNKAKRIQSTLHLARQDVEAAVLLAENQNHYAAFHCQQAAEKLTRALLVHYEIEAGPTHDLDALNGLLPPDSDWKLKLQWMSKYTPNATTFRYASPSGRISPPPDSADIIKDAPRISELIAQLEKQLQLR